MLGSRPFFFSLVLGCVSVFVPVATLVIQPPGYHISTDRLPILFWQSQVQSQLLGSNCAEPLYTQEVSPFFDQLVFWQISARLMFAAQGLVWVVAWYLLTQRQRPFERLSLGEYLLFGGGGLGLGVLVFVIIFPYSHCLFFEGLGPVGLEVFLPYWLLAGGSLFLGLQALRQSRPSSSER